MTCAGAATAAFNLVAGVQSLASQAVVDANQAKALAIVSNSTALGANNLGVAAVSTAYLASNTSVLAYNQANTAFNQANNAYTSANSASAAPSCRVTCCSRLAERQLRVRGLQRRLRRSRLLYLRIHSRGAGAVNAINQANGAFYWSNSL